LDISGAISVLPAPVRGPELELELEELEPQAATPRAITPQAKMASMDLREITSLDSFVSCHAEAPSGPVRTCCRRVADL
jgi:hypothetical protein